MRLSHSCSGRNNNFDIVEGDFFHWKAKLTKSVFDVDTGFGPTIAEIASNFVDEKFSIFDVVAHFDVVDVEISEPVNASCFYRTDDSVVEGGIVDVLNGDDLIVCTTSDVLGCSGDRTDVDEDKKKKSH